MVSNKKLKKPIKTVELKLRQIKCLI